MSGGEAGKELGAMEKGVEAGGKRRREIRPGTGREGQGQLM